MALSSQALSSKSFKRSYSKALTSNTNGQQSRFVTNKRFHLLNTLPSHHRAYYSSSSDEDDLEHEYSAAEQEQLESSIFDRKRRFSLPYNRRLSVVSKPMRRNSKCVADSSNVLKNLNSNSNITKIISAATGSEFINNNNDEVISNNIPLASENIVPQCQSLPSSDRAARARCFDYLMGAIDEAWARYCDTTSFAEERMYNRMDASTDFPTTPMSAASSDYDSDYKTDGTELTDYESEFEYTNKKTVSQQPESIKIQNLKDRLIKAKNFLQDFVDSDDSEDVAAFWGRWDLIKYATIELVEDDDDDEVIEDTIEDLEKGRCF
ncbi:hypothetical protein DASC09_015150 [Saccharomycopsis crataegensis]|uniref:Uncharacterized protein n=1 Tax=Saccharomycopsis crataegensis TaxID=43959 RepID=A0AAV5QIH8_9ASCO|nr:hypothetical protein DASC09_015150 [Saccharomycopsis crataegensis]